MADERDAYAGFKKVLYAGTCIWTIAPQNAELIKAAVKLAALKALSEAELAEIEGIRAKSAAADIYARYKVLGPMFLEEIYYALGGAIGLARAPAIKDFKAAIKAEGPRLDYAISVVQIYHYHAMYLSSEPRYGKPSLNKAAPLIAKLGILHGGHKAPLKSRSVKAAWAQSRESIALLYAASTIKTASGKTLLERIRLAENNFEDDGPLIVDWLSRAQFVVNYVLSKCVETETYDDNGWVIPDSVPQQIMPTPSFTDEQKEIIRVEFSRSAI